MNNHRPESIRKILAALLALTFFLYLPGATVGARTLEDIQRDIQNTTNQRNADKAQQKTLDQQLADTENRLHALELDIGILQDQLNVVQASRADAEQALVKIEANLAVAEDRLAERNDLINARLSGIYKQGDTGYLEVILGAASFDDFVSRMTYLSMIVKSDTRVMREFKDARDKVQKNRDLADSKKQDVLSRERAIQAIKAPLDRKNEEILAEKKNKEDLYAQLQNDAGAKDAMLAELVKEQQAASGRSVGGGARPAAYSFIWPAGSADLITSPYGYRVHPIFGDIRFHYGLDIGVDYAPVVSPANGTVLYVGWDDAVGNTIEIDHGGGIKTRYCHLMTGSTLVYEGDYVAKGQQIATSGNTGYLSAGAHLHFEVYDYVSSNDEPQYCDRADFGGAPYSSAYPYTKGYTVSPLDWLP